MDFADIDQSKLPIIIFKINPINSTIAQYEEYLQVQKEIMVQAVAEKKRLVIVFDFTHLKFLSSEMRIKRGNFLKDNNDLIKKTLEVTIMVTPNIVSRTMLQGVMLVFKPSVPTPVVASMREAMKLAEETAAQLPVSQK